jgi:hypothetical protein
MVSRVGLASMLDPHRYPEHHLAYQRPVLRVLTGAVCLFAAGLLVRLVLFPSPDEDEAVWWAPLLLGVVLGGMYQYITARLVVDATHANIRNATVVVSVPLGHVVDVEPGADLVLVTSYKRFHCTGVEAGAFQAGTGLLPSQDLLREAILAAAAAAGNADDPPARWRPRPPMPLTALTIAVGILGAVIVSINDGPLLS